MTLLLWANRDFIRWVIYSLGIVGYLLCAAEVLHIAGYMGVNYETGMTTSTASTEFDFDPTSGDSYAKGGTQ